MRTTSGQLFQTLALVVVFALACSLLIALTLVPMLASRFLTIRPREQCGQRRPGVRGRASSRAFSSPRRRLPGRALGYALHHRVRVLLEAPGGRRPGRLGDALRAGGAGPADGDQRNRGASSRWPARSMAIATRYLDELADEVRRVAPMSEWPRSTRRCAATTPSWRSAWSTPQSGRSTRPCSPTPSGGRLGTDSRRRDPGSGPVGPVDAAPAVLAGGGAEEVEVELRGYDLDRGVALAAGIRRRMQRVHGVVEVAVTEREGRLEENLIFSASASTAWACRSSRWAAPCRRASAAAGPATSARAASSSPSPSGCVPRTARQRPIWPAWRCDAGQPDGAGVHAGRAAPRSRARQHPPHRRAARAVHHRQPRARRAARRCGRAHPGGAGGNDPCPPASRSYRRRLPEQQEAQPRLRDRHRHGPAAGLHGAGRPVRALRRSARS